MKSTRQNIILQIIAEQEIETQNQLMDVLAQRGVPSTQATLSRDIKELHLTKTLAPSGKYRYAAPAADEFPGYDERLKKIFRECVTSYAEAQNIIVIKTLPGLASAACSALDSMRIDTLVGTLAGDDTAFLLMKDNTSADEFSTRSKSCFEDTAGGEALCCENCILKTSRSSSGRIWSSAPA